MAALDWSQCPAVESVPGNVTQADGSGSRPMVSLPAHRSFCLQPKYLRSCRHMSDQELNLVEFAAGKVAQPGAGAPEIVRAIQAGKIGRSFGHVRRERQGANSHAGSRFLLPFFGSTNEEAFPPCDRYPYSPSENRSGWRASNQRRPPDFQTVIGRSNSLVQGKRSATGAREPTVCEPCVRPTRSARWTTSSRDGLLRPSLVMF